jgi:DNA-binding response OmpR family regulator
MPSIWLVEDDQSIGSALARTFEAEGYATTWVQSLDEARALQGTPDLVVLDRGLPDGDGLDLCRELRVTRPTLRVLMLTARSDEIDVVLGLDAGAADYVAKPFRLAELLARVRAQLRVGDDTASAEVSEVRVGSLVIDLAARRVRVGGREVSLRPKEFDLLARLAAEPGTVVRRETLMADVWDSHWFRPTKTLDVHIAAVRRRIDDGGASRITTVRGVGYRLDATP